MASTSQTVGSRACRVWLAPAVVLVAVAVASADAAVIRSAEPFLGVTHHQVFQRPGNTDDPVLPRQIAAQILEIEMDAPGLDFFLTPEASPDAVPPPPSPHGYVVRSTTRDFVDSVGAQLGINGDFYANPGSTYAQVVHTAVSEGEVYSSRGGHLFNVTQDSQAGIWDSLPALTAAGVTPWTALAGNQRILTAGQVTAPLNSSYTTTLNPHTAIGVSENRDRVFFFVVDGRQPGFSNGMRTDEMAELMRSFGAWDAINVDGGGSTTMVMDDSDNGVQDARVLNVPSDGSERLVASNLAVFATPNPDYVPLKGIGQPSGTPNPVHGTLTLLESFESGLGLLEPGLDLSRSSNVGAATAMSADTAIAYHGGSSLRIDYAAGDAPNQASALHLGSDDLDEAVADPDRLAMGGEGYFGFLVRLEPDAGSGALQVALDLDDGTTAEHVTLHASARSVAADGLWHLVQWRIDSGSRTWSPVSPIGPNTFLDRLILGSLPGGSSPWSGTVWIDTLAYDPNQPLTEAVIPEPSALAAVLVLVGGSRRGRHAA